MKFGNFFDGGDATALAVGEAVGWAVGLFLLSSLLDKAIIRCYWRSNAAKSRRWAVDAISKTTVAAVRGATFIDVECPICLGQYLDEEEVGELPCTHLFHYTCVAIGCRNVVCPVCRDAIEPSSSEV